MALTYRLYRTGTFAPRPGVRRSVLSRYIFDDGSGAGFEQWDFSAKASMYCLAVCEPTVHAQCVADPDVIVLSPELADLSAIQTWLDGDLGTISAAVRDAIEADLIPVDDIGALNRRRELMRRIATYYRVGVYMTGTNDAAALDFLGRALTLRVNQVPAGTRDRIQAWMEERGLATNWITAQTLVREVLKYILANVSLIPLRFVSSLI